MDSLSFSFDPDTHAAIKPHGNEHPPHKNTCKIFKRVDLGLTGTDLCLMLLGLSDLEWQFPFLSWNYLLCFEKQVLNVGELLRWEFYWLKTYGEIQRTVKTIRRSHQQSVYQRQLIFNNLYFSFLNSFPFACKYQIMLPKYY